MNNTQLQQYISAHNKQVELIESLRKQIKDLKEKQKHPNEGRNTFAISNKKLSVKKL